jgi:TonB-linked SusC/RagA family outer membrane protein
VQLLIRRIGYKRYLLTVPASQNTVEAPLERDVLELEEVVVTGVATGVSRQNLANAIAKVDGDDVSAVSSQSVEDALQGKVAGADIQRNSGAPGGGLQVRLRGVSSINATAQPLWVVDGVIVSDVGIPSNQNEVTAAAGGNNPALSQDGQVNRIADLNPNDIESIEVLKGASASAIYGSKASNGVIIVTTKRGRSGRPQINASQRFGTFAMSNKLGSRVFEDAAEVDDQFGAGTAAATGFTPGVVFDHEEELAGRNALSSETLFSMTGGGETTRYFVSGLWKDDAGIMQNTGFEKQSLRANIDQTFSDRVTANLSTNIVHTLGQRGLTNNDNAGVSPYMVLPFTPSFVNLQPDQDGVYPANPFERSNPLQTLALMENDEDVWRFITSARVEVTAARSANHDLRFIGLAGADFFQQKNDLFFPPELQFEDDDGFPGTTLISNSDNLNLNVNGSVVWSYVPTSGSAQLTTSAGVQYETSDLDIARITARDLTGGQRNIDNATNVTVRQDRSRIEDLGFYLQEEVLFLNERLLLTGGFRADQSSANSDDTKLYFFPKAAGSYRIPVEGGAVDAVKFRVAYGESGNQPLFGQKFTPLDATNNIGGIGGLTVPGSVLDANVGAGDLRPERQREIEGGVDLAMFGQRTTLEFTVYQKNISDLLLTRRLAPSTGFSQEIFNAGKLRTRGAEVSLGIVPVQTRDLTWVFRTNFFLSRSEVTELPVPSFIPASAGFGVGLGVIRIREGESATQLVGNVPGDAGPEEAKVGDVNPDFKMSFNNDISYKGLNLYFLWDWQQGGDIVNLTRLLYDAGGITSDWDEPTQGGTSSAGLDRLLAGPLVGGDTRLYVEPATFVKLRELTLSYQLPQSVTQSLGPVRDMRLSFSARDLLTFSDYTGIDPEVSNFGNQPTGRNIDVAPFPPSRSFWFGIDLGF